jgi:hypothetical protein
LKGALGATGVQQDLHQRQPICKEALQSACRTWQLKQLQDAATGKGTTKLQQCVGGGTLDAAQRANELRVCAEGGCCWHNGFARQR